MAPPALMFAQTSTMESLSEPSGASAAAGTTAPAVAARATEPLRLLDRVLSIDSKRRFRLAQTAVAAFVTVSGVAAMQYLAWLHLASWPQVMGWTAFALSGIAGFFVVIRAGWTEGMKDPALTLPQMAYGICCCASAYAIAGPARGAVFPLLMIVLMFGVFSLTPRQVLAVSACTLALFASTMAAMSWRQHDRFAPTIEWVHLWMLFTMLPVVAVLALQLRRLRSRLQDRTRELAAALERNQFLATRDELTGLINRRQMSDLVERARLRAGRTGAAFCVALIDLDHFKRVNDRYGHAAGDSVLRAFASETRRSMRATDAVGRWGGEEFLILMPDSTLPRASEGAERLRRSWEALSITLEDATLHETFSAGVVQHQVGEEAARTIERADMALYRAKAAGRNRVTTG